ncbi:Reticulocyte-binding protein 2 a, partial [Orchesella cincta]
TTTHSTTTSSSSSAAASSSGSSQKKIDKNEIKELLEADDCCCGEPVVYKPGFCCYEKVKGPFKRPIPTPYDNYVKKYCQPSRPPVPPYHDPCSSRLTRPPPPAPYLMKSGCCKSTCDGAREHKVCQAELQRLRDERWKKQEKKALLEEKRRREWLDEQYLSQARQWEDSQRRCADDQKRRKKLLREMETQRKEMKRLREEEAKWRECKRKLYLKQKQKEEDMWLKEYNLREEEKRLAQERIQVNQEDKWLNGQMAPRETEGMAIPELEELRRMFAPVVRGPKETFEYFLVEPRPTTAEMKKSATLKMAALMGLRDQHGIHLDLSDRCKKRTTIQLAMGPKLTSGERSQVKEMNSPLLRMQNTTDGEPGQPGPGPNFNGSRLYGTVVIPKGQLLSPYYTDPYAITF